MEGLIVLHGAPRPSGFALWAEGVFVPHDGRGAPWRTIKPSIVGYPRPPMKVPKSHELFRRMSSAEVASVVAAACDDDELPEKIAGGVLTYQQIPLKRFSKLPEETRLADVRRKLRDKRASDLGLYVLSAALTRRQAALISSFLEALKLSLIHI